MDLFNNLANVRITRTNALSPAESFVGIMLATIAADGHIAIEETQSLISTLYRMKLFQGYPKNYVFKMIDGLTEMIKTQNVDRLLDVSAQSLPKYLHETAFAVATDLILSDGEVSQEEKQILQNLCRYLSIPKEQVNKIIEVVIIKNRG